MQRSTCFNNVAIVTEKENDYRIYFWGMQKKGIKRMKNAHLKWKKKQKNILKKKTLNSLTFYNNE